MNMDFNDKFYDIQSSVRHIIAQCDSRRGGEEP